VRRQLLRALVHSLDEESFTDVSIDRLAERAGLARSTFYLHFSDKVELLEALAVDVIDEIVDAGEYWWSLGPGITKEDLREGLERLADAYRSHHTVMTAVVEAASYDERIRRHFELLVTTGSKQIADHIRKGQEQGFVARELDAETTAGWITWMSERGLYKCVIPADAAQTERHMQTYTNIVWNTLYEGAR